MSASPDTAPLPGSAEIEALLAFLPLFERPGFRASEASPAGYYQWSEELNRFHETLYADGWVYNFDWPAWQPEAETLMNDDNALAAVDLETLRKLLTIIARKERFCENTFPGACSDGTFTRILRRMKDCHNA